MERNFGIDLLRIAAMGLIAAIHVLIGGGLTAAADKGTVAYGVLIFCQAIAFCCVNCYGLISGYVGIQSNFKYYKTVLIWLQVVFYSLLITALFALIRPQWVTKADWISAFFPISTKAYWYATAYIGMTLFLPFVNKALHALTKKELGVLAATVFLLFSVYQICTGKQHFNTNGGYSLLWLLALYIIGAAVRLLKLDEILSRRLAAGIAAIGILITFLAEYIPVVLWDAKKGRISEFQYIYFSVVLTAFGMLIFFSQMRITNRRIQKGIRFFAPLSFSVYLIHLHPLIWKHLFKGAFAPISDLPLPLMLLSLLGCTLAIYLICSLLDLPRYYLFKKTRLAQHLKHAEQKLNETANKKIKVKQKL